MLARGEVSAKIVELNKVPNGRQMKRALLEITGQRTVPNIFIGGEHIGGSDVLAKMARSGVLSQKLSAAGVQFKDTWTVRQPKAVSKAVKSTSKEAFPFLLFPYILF